jgi:hypothetical protein
MEFEQSSGGGSSYSLYTGITNLEVVLVNPTLAEIQQYNPNAKREPVYEQGTVEFWLKNDDVFTSVRFILSTEPRINNAGDKRVFTNDFGQSVYAPSAEFIKDTYAWFNQEGLREAYTGEAELMQFIRSWLAVPVKGKCKFVNRTAVFSGDLTELKQTFANNKVSKDGKVRQVKVALMVTSTETDNGVKRYHRVYARYFEPAWMTSLKSWQKELFNEDGSPRFSADMQNSLEYKKYVAPTEATGVSVPTESAPLPF